MGRGAGMASGLEQIFGPTSQELHQVGEEERLIGDAREGGKDALDVAAGAGNGAGQKLQRAPGQRAGHGSIDHVSVGAVVAGGAQQRERRSGPQAAAGQAHILVVDLVRQVVRIRPTESRSARTAAVPSPIPCWRPARAGNRAAAGRASGGCSARIPETRSGFRRETPAPPPPPAPASSHGENQRMPSDRLTAATICWRHRADRLNHARCGRWPAPGRAPACRGRPDLRKRPGRGATRAPSPEADVAREAVGQQRIEVADGAAEAMPPSAARANSAPTSHQKCGGSGCPAKCACTASRIFFETASMATGISAATRRQLSTPQTTGGPDRQTIPSSEGT